MNEQYSFAKCSICAIFFPASDGKEMKVFYEKGYEKTSISDIAKEMNVAQGLCCRYFSSKEELFDTALDQYAQKQAEYICRAIRTRMSLTELIEEVPALRKRNRMAAMRRKYTMSREM